MFIFALVLGFIIKLSFPKNRSIRAVSKVSPQVVELEFFSRLDVLCSACLEKDDHY